MLKAQVLVTKRTGPGIEEARRILRDVTTRLPTQPEAWQLLAQIELDQEEPGRALDVALQGLAHNEGKSSGPLLLLKARAEKARSPAMAALTLKGLLDQEPNNVQVLIDLADAYARSGHAKQAVDLLGQKLPRVQRSRHAVSVKSLTRKPSMPTGSGRKRRSSLASSRRRIRMTPRQR